MANRNTLKNKVVINIGATRRRKVASKKNRRSLGQPSPPHQPIPPPPRLPPPQVIYSVNPSLDPFAVRQQLQQQSQLRVNQDLLLNTLRSAMTPHELQQSLSPMEEPKLKAINLFPPLKPLDKPEGSLHLSLSPKEQQEEKEAAKASSSSSSPIVEPSSSLTASAASSSIIPGTPTPSFIRTAQGSIKIRNPNTNRYIAYRGKAYKELVKAGKIMDVYPPEELMGGDEEEEDVLEIPLEPR